MAAEPISCSAGHFICTECLRQYVQSLSTSALRDCGGRLICPHRDERPCDRALSVTELRAVLGVDALAALAEKLMQLTSTLAEEAKARRSAGPDGVSLRERVIAALGFPCPNEACRIEQDCAPDGCTNTRCLSCGTFYCFSCFAVFPSKTATHEHGMATHGSVYPSAQQLASAHHQRRMRLLTDLLGSVDQAQRADVLRQVRRELADLQLPTAEAEWDALVRAAHTSAHGAVADANGKRVWMRAAAAAAAADAARVDGAPRRTRSCCSQCCSRAHATAAPRRAPCSCSQCAMRP